MSMEFENIKKIWDTQNNQPMYVINESELQKNITTKKNKGVHITNVTELLSVVVNIGAGTFITFLNSNSNVYLYILAGWMFITGVYCLTGRVKRIRGNSQYDRTMLGDLDHAVSVASYQVRFSSLMRWNVIPVGALVVLSMLGRPELTGLIIGLVLFFALTFYATGFEHRYYVRRKKDVEELRKILLN